MRILIVGTGIAALTLATVLQRQGRAPILIERDDELGYALALWPQGSRVPHSPGV
jgi:2-polyprenyl-6-methoxyphenol hydroxylase-like FAD-dependent oxidoreductase